MGASLGGRSCASEKTSRLSVLGVFRGAGRMVTPIGAPDLDFYITKQLA